MFVLISDPIHKTMELHDIDMENMELHRHGKTWSSMVLNGIHEIACYFHVFLHYIFTWRILRRTTFMFCHGLPWFTSILYTQDYEVFLLHGMSGNFHGALVKTVAKHRVPCFVSVNSMFSKLLAMPNVSNGFVTFKVCSFKIDRSFKLVIGR